MKPTFRDYWTALAFVALAVVPLALSINHCAGKPAREYTPAPTSRVGAIDADGSPVIVYPFGMAPGMIAAFDSSGRYLGATPRPSDRTIRWVFQGYGVISLERSPECVCAGVPVVIP